MIRIGIDTGGTFTDLVAFDPDGGRLAFHKVASTPDAPARAIVQGVRAIVERVGARPEQVDLLIHGTTVATNAVLQRAGARVALITTAGFRDVLQIQRQDRPRLYDLRGRRARPLVPRALRFELRERMRFDGSVQTPVDREQLYALVDLLRRERVEAVAVGLLHSYVNPGARARGGPGARRASAGCSGVPVARAGGRAGRVRALQHLCHERLRAARDRGLPGAVGTRAERTGYRRTVVHHEVERRRDVGARRRPPPR